MNAKAKSAVLSHVERAHVWQELRSGGTGN